MKNVNCRNASGLEARPANVLEISRQDGKQLFGWFLPIYCFEYLRRFSRNKTYARELSVGVPLPTFLLTQRVCSSTISTSIILRLKLY